MVQACCSRQRRLSLDNVLLHRNPALAGKQWFRWMSGSLPLRTDMRLSGSWRWLCWHSRDLQRWHYNYYRGRIDIFSRRTGQPTKHHLN